MATHVVYKFDGRGKYECEYLSKLQVLSVWPCSERNCSCLSRSKQLEQICTTGSNLDTEIASLGLRREYVWLWYVGFCAGVVYLLSLFTAGEDVGLSHRCIRWAFGGG